MADFAVELLAKKVVSTHEIDELIKLLNDRKETINDKRKVFFYPARLKDLIKEFRKELFDCCIPNNYWRNRKESI